MLMLCSLYAFVSCLCSVAVFIAELSKPKLAILFHASSSTTARHYNKKLLVFMSNLLEDSRLDLTKMDVGVFNFGKAPMTVFDFGTYENRQDFRNAVLRIPKTFRSPSSNLGATLKMLVETNDVVGGLPDTVMIISDTPSVGVQDEENRYIQRLKSAHSKIYFIGISYPYDGPMQSLVSEPHSQYFHTVESYDSLLNDEDLKRNFVSTLFEDLNSSGNGQMLPVLSTEPLVSDQDPILQKGRGLQGDGKTYLAIVFQSSSSTSPQDYFKHLLVFLSKLVSEDHFTDRTLDVALINYGKNTRVLFNFNSQNSLSSAKSAILNTPKTLRSKKANVGDALQLLNTDVFNTTEQIYNGRGHVVIVTDKGFDRSLKTVPEANLLINAGVRIHSIGITDKATNDLMTISSKPAASYFQNVENYAELNQNPDILLQVMSSIRSSPPDPEESTTESTVVRSTGSVTSDDVRHVAILFQSSSSTSPLDYFKHLLVFLSNIADEQQFVSNKTNFALVNYGKKNRILFNFNTFRDISDVKSAILRAPKNLRSKKSNIGEALKIMNTDIFNTSERNYGGKGHLVFLSDKMFDVTRVNALEEANLLRNSGIRIHTIGVTDKPLEDMEDIVSWPMDSYFQTVESYPELVRNPSVLERLVTNIKLSPMDPRLTTLRSPPTTMSSKTPDPTEADVVLVFHALENLKKTDYKKKLLKFLFKLVKKANIDKGKVRVALVNYGNDAQTIFDLTQYKTKKTVIKAIKKTPKNLKFNNADLGKALRLIRTSIFRPPKDRHGVQNHVILVTDSASTGSRDQMQEEVRLLKDAGVMFHTVGIGNVDKSELKFIASDPDSKHLQILKSHSELLKMKKSAKKIFKAIPALRKKKKGKGKKKPKKTKKPIKSTTPTTSTAATAKLTTMIPTVVIDTTSYVSIPDVFITKTTAFEETTTRSTHQRPSPTSSSTTTAAERKITAPSTEATTPVAKISMETTAETVEATKQKTRKQMKTTEAPTLKAISTNRISETSTIMDRQNKTTMPSTTTKVNVRTRKVTTQSPIKETTAERKDKTTEKIMTPVAASTIEIEEKVTEETTTVLAQRLTEDTKQTSLSTKKMITETKPITTKNQPTKSKTVKGTTGAPTRLPTQDMMTKTTPKSTTNQPTREEIVTRETEKQTLPTQIMITDATEKSTTKQKPKKGETTPEKTEQRTPITTQIMISNATRRATTQLPTVTRSTPIKILETSNMDTSTQPNQEDIVSTTGLYIGGSTLRVRDTDVRPSGTCNG